MTSYPPDSATRVTTLENGLRVATHVMPHVETAALGLWIRAGSRDESSSENGAAHFLEHMAFKGTPTRTAFDVACEIESAGGEINACTGSEATSYHARVLKEGVGTALDVISDISLRSVFPPEEIARERLVVEQEIAASRDSPEDLVFDLAQEASFPNQPLGRSILGEKAGLASFDRKFLRRWRDSFYVAEESVVCAAGRVEHERIVASASEAFSAMPSRRRVSRERARFEGVERLGKRPVEQTHAAFSLRLAGRDAETSESSESSASSASSLSSWARSQVLSSVLGGGMSSRLFRRLREERGLCYSIFSYASLYDEIGTLTVYAACDPRRSRELLFAAAEEIRDAAARAERDETDRARAQIKSAAAIALESCSARAEQLARHVLFYGRPIPIAETLAALDAVDVDAIRSAASEAASGSPALALAGDLNGAPSRDELRDALHG